MLRFYGYITLLAALAAIMTLTTGVEAVGLFLLWCLVLLRTLKVIPDDYKEGKRTSRRSESDNRIDG